MKDYSVIEASSVDELEERTEEMISVGWVPLGGPFILPWVEGRGICLRWPQNREATHGFVCQSMTSPAVQGQTE